MHIGVDAWSITQEAKAGIPTYLSNLLKALAEVDSENRYTLYVKEVPKDVTIENDNFKIEILPFWPSKFPPYWRHTQLPVKLLSERPDVFLSSSTLPMYYCLSKRVLLVYDVTPWLFPHLSSRGLIDRTVRNISKKVTPHAIMHAEAIIAISHSTKRDLVNLFKSDPQKIFVVHGGWDNSVFKPHTDSREIEGVKRKYKIVGKYIFYLGTLEPRKNISRIIEAFASLRAQEQINRKLVLAGEKGWLYSDIFHKVEKLDLEKDVIFTGYVPQQDLPILMSGADMFVYPSLYEGFGLPPLEAMACRTPVITSNVSSLPEVVGDAGILVNPYSADEIAKAIYQVLSNGELRQRMRQKGFERAKLFSWEKAALQTLKVFQSIS